MLCGMVHISTNIITNTNNISQYMGDLNTGILIECNKKREITWNFGGRLGNKNGLLCNELMQHAKSMDHNMHPRDTQTLKYGPVNNYHKRLFFALNLLDSKQTLILYWWTLIKVNSVTAWEYALNYSQYKESDTTL